MRKLFAGALIASVSLAVGVVIGAGGSMIAMVLTVEQWYPSSDRETIEDVEAKLDRLRTAAEGSAFAEKDEEN